MAKRKKVDLPAPPALLLWLCAQLSHEDLKLLAQADYQTGVKQHLNALERIARGDLSDLFPLQWYPHEVLELTRWGEPASTDRSAHMRRLLACVVLLVAAADKRDRGRTVSINESLAVATDSVLHALPGCQRDWLQLLDTLAHAQEAYGAEIAFVHLARLVVLNALGESVERREEALDAAVAEVTRHRQEVGATAPPPNRPYGWALQLSPHDLRHGYWERQLNGVLEDSGRDPSGRALQAHLEALRDQRL